MKSSSTHPSLELRSHAAGMRNELATASERALWQRLRAGQLGVHFRRQVPLLGRYIVDFFAPGARFRRVALPGQRRASSRGVDASVKQQPS